MNSGQILQGDIKEGILMRIPEYQNNSYNLPGLTKGGRVKKVHEDQFENELEDSIKKRNRETKNLTKKKPKEIDHKSATHQEVWIAGSRFSNWS